MARTKGSPNKRTNQSVAAFFKSKGTTPIEMVWDLLPELEPAEQARTLLKLQEYIEPKATVPVTGMNNREDLSTVPSGTLFSILNADPNNARTGTR